MSVPVKQPIPISFSGSLDTKTDPWQVAPVDFLALNNMVYSVPNGGGGARLNKRNGFAGLGTTIVTPNPALTFSNVGGTLSSARKVFSFQNELLLNDPFNLYSYDESSNSWIYKGRSTVVSLATESVAAGKTTWFEADSSIDTTSAIKVFAFVNSSANLLSYSIQDTATGQFIVNQATFGTTYKSPRCVSIAGKSWIFALNTSDNKIYYQAIVGQTVTGSLTALITNVNASKPFFDVDVDPLSGNIYIAYFNTTPAITISALSTSMVVGNSISKVESATHGVSFFGDGTNIWVVYNNGTATKGFIVNNAVTATTLAPTVIDSSATSANVNNVVGTWSSTQSKAFIFYDPVTFISPGLVATSAINFNTMTVSGTVGTPTLFMGSVLINSKAFAVSGIPHLVGVYLYPSPTALSSSGYVMVQPTNFLLNLYNVTPSMGGSAHNDVVANIAAKISPDEAGPNVPQPGVLTGIHPNGASVWEMALLQSSNFAFETTPTVPFFAPTGVIDVKFDFSLSNPDAQDLGKNAEIAGGQVTMYDGANVAEQNFHIYPNAPTAVIATTGGAMGSASANSLYGYILTYEWIDNLGQVHRSFTSPNLSPLALGQAYTFASGVVAGQVTLTVPTLRVTNKSGSQVVINIYRTLANGSVYFLVGAFGGFFGTYGTVLNDPSVDTLTYVDTASDAAIQGNLQLYTTGAQPYFAPPATAVLASYKNRLLAVPYEGGFDFLYSNKVLQNFPVQFVPFFDQNIGTIGGPLITLAGMDDKIIIFKSGTITGPAIWYMVGQGPSQSGAGNDFNDPLPVAVDAGCVDRASVVLTPVGLMFKSSKGIYLIGRDLSASYIGAPVEAYNQYNVLSASLIPDTTQVRFLISNGLMLVYDYFYKRWSTFSSPAGISDCIFQGRHVYVSSTGQVYKETPGVYVDGTNTPVLLNFSTSWIKLAGLQGYQRAYFVFLLGQYLSAHQLSISLYTNFSSVAEQTDLITPDSTNFLENWRVFFANQRCQSFQISLQEVYTGTPGAGVAISGLNLIAGIKSPFRTISSAQSVG